MASAVFYSVSPYGTGDIKTGSPTITISSGVATLSVAQTGNIGCGVCIETASNKYYIAPNRLGFDSGGTTEIKVGDKVAGATSGATGIVRQVEVTSGSWSGGDAAGYIYFETTSGTWQDNEQINRTKPSSVANVATVNGTLQGNIGNGNTQFVVKTATGGTPSDLSSTTVTSIHHEYASLSAFEAGFTDSNHINNPDLTSSGADVIAHACCYYDHDDYTLDTTAVAISFGTNDTTHYLFVFTPVGGSESINKQRHEGKWNTNKYILSASRALYISEANVFVEGLQLDNAGSSSWGIDCRYSGEDGTTRIACCIAKNGTSYCCYLDDNGHSISFEVCNNIIYDFDVGIRSSMDAGGYVYNNTIADCTSYGIDGAYDSFGLKNNLCYNNGTDFYRVGNTTASNNASSDDTAVGSNSRTNQTFTFIDVANDDYHLASGDSGAKDYGADLSSDSYLPIWRDIDLEPRGATWDIGADEYVSAGGLTITPSGISSSEAFGTATISTGAVTVTPSAIASGEVFGDTTLVPGSVIVTPSGITTLEAFGSPELSTGPTTILPSGIDSLEAFGATTLVPGQVTISPSGIVSLEAFGSATLSLGAITISPSGIASLEAFGTPALTPGSVIILPTGIASLEAFGTAVVSTGIIAPSSITSEEAFGTPEVGLSIQYLNPSAITSAEAFGTPLVAITSAILEMLVDGSNPPTTLQARIKKEMFDRPTTSGQILIGFIAPGQYYKVNEASPSATLVKWIEVSWS